MLHYTELNLLKQCRDIPAACGYVHSSLKVGRAQVLHHPGVPGLWDTLGHNEPG